MDEYFKKAIPQYTYRIQKALDSIPKDLSDEQLVLAAKCTDRLNDSHDKLESLQNGPERLGAFQRIIRDIEYIETVGIAALERSNEVDEKLNRLVKKIRKEINYPLLLPPAVSAISKDYFYVHTRFNFNLICVPPGERHSLLHLPDLYHELAHPLLTEKSNFEIKPFKDCLNKIRDFVLNYFSAEITNRSRQRGPEIIKQQPEFWLENWYRSWAIEFLCDLFAVYTLGPAFVWSHYHLCAKKTENPFEAGLQINSTHPADNARMDIMLFALDRLGFANTANKIEEKWKDFIRSSSSFREVEYEQCYPRKILAKVEDLAYQSVSKMNVRIVSPDTKDFVHSILNNAWIQFWQDQSSYTDWERTEIECIYEEFESSTNSNYSETFKSHKNTTMNTAKLEESKNKLENLNDQSVDETQNLFKLSLQELQSSLKTNNGFVRSHDFLDDNDIHKLELVFQEPSRGGIYDHAVFDRKLYLSDELVRCFHNYWQIKKINDEQKKRMCKLFYLHEFKHTEMV